MPRRCIPDPSLRWLIAAQDEVVHSHQATGAGLTPEAVRYRKITGRWRQMLPHVFLTNSGAPTRRQLLVAALLYAGPDAAIDGADACWFYGVKAIPLDRDRVQIRVPRGSTVRSVGYLVVRQSATDPPSTTSTELLRYVDPATAVISATRRMHHARSVLAGLSDALQRGVVDYDDLLEAHRVGPPRNRRIADDALEQLGSGIRSAAEADLHQLVRRSNLRDKVEYNVWLRLRCGRVVCVDALIESSAVVHEVNGRKAHAREDLSTTCKIAMTRLPPAD